MTHSQKEGELIKSSSIQKNNPKNQDYKSHHFLGATAVDDNTQTNGVNLTSRDFFLQKQSSEKHVKETDRIIPSLSSKMNENESSLRYSHKSKNDEYYYYSKRSTYIPPYSRSPPHYKNNRNPYPIYDRKEYVSNYSQNKITDHIHHDSKLSSSLEKSSSRNRMPLYDQIKTKDIQRYEYKKYYYFF